MKIFISSIGRKLALLVLLSVLPALAILLHNGMEQRRHSINAATNDVLLLAHSIAEAQKAIATSTRQILSTLAKMPAIQAMDAQASNRLLKAVTEKNPEYLGLALTDVTGKVVASNRPHEGVSLADRKHFRDALAKRDFAVGEYIIARLGPESPTFAFALPVLDQEGTVKGVLTAVLRLDHFASFIDVSHLPENSFIALTDHQGIRLFYYPPREETNPIGKPIRSKNWETAQKANGPGLFVRQGSDEIRRIFAFEPVRLAPDADPYMYVWAAIPEEPTLAPANAALRRSLLLMTLSTALALVIAWAVGRKTLIAPIQRLVATTRNFAQGRLETRSDLTAAQQGEIGTLASAFNDMADSLAKSQKMLKERQAHLEEAQRIAHIGSWEWEEATGKSVWSKELFRILEIDPDGSVPSLAEQEKIFSADSMQAVRAAMQNTLESGAPYEVVMERTRQGLPSRWLLARGEVRRDEAGKIVGLRGTALDVTESRLAELEREKLQNQLSQAQKLESIGRLAGGVAHDFNNMLAVILGHAEMAMVKLSPSDAPLHTELMAISKAGQRSADITKQLLAFARKQIISPKVINLNEVVEAMLKMLGRLIGEQIELVWLPGVPLWQVKMDPVQVDQVLANICINARDAISGNGVVTLKTENVNIDATFCDDHADCEPGEYVVLSVRDNGCGMDQTTKKNLFEPFFTTKELGKGTGLGLATIYGIVRQNQGFITVESAPQKGTTIRIHLPRHSGEDAEAEAAGQEEIPLGSGETILLVEDEPMVMNLGKDLLSSLGYTVLSAATPSEAIRMAENKGDSIALLLTDVIMPEMNGKELADQLKASFPSLKCLFMSGYPAETIVHQGMVDPDVLLIPKPFLRKDLAAKVREALRRD